MRLDARAVGSHLAGLVGVALRSFALSLVCMAVCGIALAASSWFLLRERAWWQGALAAALALIESLVLGFLLGATSFRRPVLGTLVVLTAYLPAAQTAEPVGTPPIRPAIIVPSRRATEMLAARELQTWLERMYHPLTFPVATSTPPADCTHLVWLGTRDLLSGSVTAQQAASLQTPGAYALFTDATSGINTAYLVGADAQGLWHGVYGLLRSLGCGFHLSFDTVPTRKPREFSFAGWPLRDEPLVPRRLVFNWHNFLSGCSTWDVEQWQQWTEQSQKMGYNAIMVHAYGNNPMAGFSFRGAQKPVGYLSSTRVGRDWSTNHVRDVRRLWGGAVFSDAVFGSQAAIEGTDAERTQAAQQLMARVFAHAERRSMDLFFAVDVDTPSANPQQLIRLLPQDARFQIAVPAGSWPGQEDGTAWLPNPEIQAGYEFYLAQVAELLRVYPQLDCLVVWHRKGKTPWMSFTQEEMPAAWRQEFEQEVARTPAAAEFWHAPQLFALAKVVRAFQRAVRQLDRGDVQIAFGSWDFDFLPAADRFLPADVPLIPLDWLVLRDESIFATAERRASVAAVAGHRPVIPIAWAHHDDGNYVGRPYTPPADFCDLLDEMQCRSAGFGIIHWTTKPLDLYFQSLVNQAWSASRNEPLSTTCRRFAEDCLGRDNLEAVAIFTEYLRQWITTMPKIGRETSDFFIDHELADLDAAETGHRRRTALLGRLAGYPLQASGREWLDYFTGLEQFVLDVYRTEAALRRAQRALREGHWNEARAAIAQCHPEQVVERYSEFSRRGGLTRGEEGLIVSLNTRWLPHYVRLRQQLGVETVRLNFAATSHDPLAQSRGIFTFYFDQERQLWQTLGQEETGVAVIQLPADAELEKLFRRDGPVDGEIATAGISLARPWEMQLAPIMNRDSRGQRYAPVPLAAGRYRLTLLLRHLPSESSQQAAIDLQVSPSYKGSENRLGDGATGQPPRTERLTIAAQQGTPPGILIKTCDVELERPGNVQLKLRPAAGQMVLCGLWLEPLTPTP